MNQPNPIPLSSAQEAARLAVVEWYERFAARAPMGRPRAFGEPADLRPGITGGPSQVFRLFGYAGTGKTTIAKAIASSIDTRGRSVVFAAYTGKAASVLRAKGCNATTIHGMIYRPRTVNRLVDQDIEKPVAETAAKIAETIETNNLPLRYEADVEFDLRRHALSTANVALIVIDECSMVGRKIGQDLLSFGIPVLVLGDPAQLPPIGDAGFFTSGAPDILLTEIHRQKDGCGILDMATTVRTGGRLECRAYDESLVMPLSRREQINPFDFDQVIVGRHATRAAWNRRMREQLGFTTTLPAWGDKLVCLRNDYRSNLMNGEMIVSHGVVEDVDEDTFRLRCYDPAIGRHFDTLAHKHFFEGRAGDLPFGETAGATVFDWGYAITGHKSQGSQWGRVLIQDESFCFRDARAAWLYTAITRAADHVTVMR